MLREMATHKRYWEDPFEADFVSRVVSAALQGPRPNIVLEATAFYPEGGGQLPDQGTLEIAGCAGRVEDVQIEDDGTIRHFVDDAFAEALRAARVALAGAQAKARLDFVRRRDHMSQHTAQHMLSRALLDVAQAPTVSSRLGAETSTVDVEAGAFDEGHIARAEDLANDIVLADRTISALYPTPEALAKIPLRREPKVADNVRVIEVEGFDFSPCGGTHCTRSGQVGPIRVVGVERHRGAIRVTFLAGRRAMKDYRAKDEALARLAADFTCGPLDVGAAISRVRADLRARSTELGLLRAELARNVGESLLREHPKDPAGLTRIAVARDDADLAALRKLAGVLAARGDVVALVAGRAAPSDDWQVVVERGADASSFDAGRWLKAFAQTHGGKGGGRADHAEGRVPASVAWRETALAFSP